ncbi:PDR/VanB family oxidoreductase [uncultured Comamonas sp.]|uniref:PDR/VanB family oxidoreductase n=1 Tax=uncultured Comamonas sp. TaxID=114710 RepID=UPI00374A094D
MELLTSLDLVVAEKQAIATDIVRLVLRHPEGELLPGAEPGAHVALDLDGLVRRYSLLHTGPALDHYSIAVLRTAQSQGGSHFVHDQLAVGDQLRVLELANEFALLPDAPHALLIGGGIGITPLLSMAEHLQQAGQSFALHQIVHDTTRLWPLAPGLPAQTHIGRSSLDLPGLLAAQVPGSQVYVCGPAGLVGAVRAAAAQLGWAPGRIHSESFGAAADASDGPLRVTLVQSGLSMDVAPGQSLLDALLAAGAWTGYECRRGVCGACLTEVVSGTPIHRDSIAPALRGNAMCTCVSWAEGPELALNL